MYKIIPFAFLLAGCSGNPVIDMKASEDPRELTGDKMECAYLADETSYFIWNRLDAWEICMQNRGYSIINPRNK